MIFSKLGGNALFFGNLGAGSLTILCSKSRIPRGPVEARLPAPSLASNGKRPIASSNNVKPSDQTSDLTEYLAPLMRSGDMYVEVPTKVSAIELISSPDTPKSQSLI